MPVLDEFERFPICRWEIRWKLGYCTMIDEQICQRVLLSRSKRTVVVAESGGGYLTDREISVERGLNLAGMILSGWFKFV